MKCLLCCCCCWSSGRKIEAEEWGTCGNERELLSLLILLERENREWGFGDLWGELGGPGRTCEGSEGLLEAWLMPDGWWLPPNRLIIFSIDFLFASYGLIFLLMSLFMIKKRESFCWFWLKILHPFLITCQLWFFWKS